MSSSIQHDAADKKASIIIVNYKQIYVNFSLELPYKLD